MSEGDPVCPTTNLPQDPHKNSIQAFAGFVFATVLVIINLTKFAVALRFL